MRRFVHLDVCGCRYVHASTFNVCVQMWCGAQTSNKQALAEFVQNMRARMHGLICFKFLNMHTFMNVHMNILCAGHEPFIKNRRQQNSRQVSQSVSELWACACVFEQCSKRTGSCLRMYLHMNVSPNPLRTCTPIQVCLRTSGVSKSSISPSLLMRSNA
jgi:hypothetical protein